MHTPRRCPPTPRNHLPLHALALACTVALAPPALHAAAVVEGFVSTNPGGTFAGGTGDFLMPDALLWAGFAGHAGDGNKGFGRVTFNGGTQASFVSIATNQPTLPDLVFGNPIPVALTSVIRVDGTGTKLTTTGVSTGLGEGDIYVTGGAQLDGRSRVCGDTRFGFFFCGSQIGATAPTRAGLEVSGAGSLYETRAVTIGTASTGTTGGSVGASVDVLSGGTLRSWSVSAGTRNGSTGNETSLGIMRVNGAGSTWVVDGYDSVVNGDRPAGLNGAASVTLGSFAGGTGKLFVEAGGTLRLERKDTNQTDQPFLTFGAGGSSEVVVTGAGSKIEIQDGLTGAMQVGRATGGTNTMRVDDGGQVLGLQYLSVGRARFANGVYDTGGNGSLVVDGTGSLLRIDGASPINTGNTGILDIGRGQASTGVVTVSGGGRIEIVSTVARPGGTFLFIGREGNDGGIAPNTFTGSGTLNIQGVGSVVEMRAADVAGGFNPAVRVGRMGTGTGTLNISAGGKLVLEGNAASTTAAQRSTSFVVGGSAGATGLNGGKGNALVTGAGSEVLMKGIDRYAAVGDGSGATGTLELSDGGQLNATLLYLGRARGGASATGTMVMDNGHLVLDGKYDSGSVATTGSSLTVGSDAGSVGTLSMSNHSTAQVVTTAAGRTASVFVGSNPVVAGGVGTLVMTTGASLTIDGAGGSVFATGLNGGTGSLTMNAASIQMAANGEAYIRGSAQLDNGSSFDAGSFFGIATASGSTGSVILNNSTITATDIVIGAGGYLGGNNGTLVGNVVNFGTLNPGNSPGTLTIQGSYKAEAGSTLVLEVENDGLGGFMTDKLIFTGPVDLGGVDIEFKFLGNTDPVQFAKTGRFMIDTFLRSGSDGSGVLDQAVFAGVAFSASAAPGYDLTAFTFDAATGSNLAPVPEPGVWAMMLGGLAALGLTRRRRAADR